MPVPASINDLSTTASNNSPAGSESPTTTDDYLRTHAAFIAVVRDSANAAYNKTNIVGTVSQSAGVPTGAIIERGSNANGEYVRWADGTQECWTNQSAAIAPGETKGFPFTNAVGFVGKVPMSFVTVAPAAFTLEIPWGMEAHTVNGATVYVRNNSSAIRDVAVFFRTIGRWY